MLKIFTKTATYRLSGQCKIIPEGSLLYFAATSLLTGFSNKGSTAFAFLGPKKKAISAKIN